MQRWLRIASFAFGIGMYLAVSAGSAQAQIPAYQMDRSKIPGFSPYLNLLRAGSSPAINYYGIVRPEIAFSNSLYQLGIEQDLLQSQQTAQQSALAAYTQLPPTGRRAGSFMTQSKYFMNNGGMGVGNAFAPGGFGGGQLGAQGPPSLQGGGAFQPKR
jgi:hypothetical protein